MLSFLSLLTRFAGLPHLLFLASSSRLAFILLTSTSDLVAVYRLRRRRIRRNQPACFSYPLCNRSSNTASSLIEKTHLYDALIPNDGCPSRPRSALTKTTYRIRPPTLRCSQIRSFLAPRTHGPQLDSHPLSLHLTPLNENGKGSKQTNEASQSTDSLSSASHDCAIILPGHQGRD